MGMTANIVVGLAASTLLCGCSVAWPPEHGGGAAEIAAATSYPSLLVAAVNADEQALQLQHARSLQALEQLHARDAMRWAPAELVLAERLAIRAGREIAGGLEADGARDLIALNERIQRIEDAIVRAAKPHDNVAP